MNSKAIVSAIAVALLMMSVPAAVLTADASDAAPSGNGDRYKVSMVEGETYTYTPEYSIAGVTTTVSGTAAAWLSVSEGKKITGTAPSVASSGGKQTYSLTIKATTQHPYQEAYQYIDITVYDKMTVSVDAPTVNTYIGGSVNTDADSNFTGAQFSMAGAPRGISINSSTGAITGTVNDTAKKYTATVTAKDLASGQTKSTSIVFNVSGKLAVNSAADMYAVNGKLVPTSGGDPNYYKLTANLSGVTFSLAGSDMPSGMKLNSNGTITGTPAAMGDHVVHVTATETATGQTASFDLNIHLVSKLSFSSVPTGGIIVQEA